MIVGPFRARKWRYLPG